MILLAHQGLSNDQIADRLSTRREIVSPWRKPFFEKLLAGLEDCQRPGRPGFFPPELVVQVKAIAGEFPSRFGVPLSPARPFFLIISPGLLTLALVGAV